MKKESVKAGSTLIRAPIISHGNCFVDSRRAFTPMNWMAGSLGSSKGEYFGISERPVES